MSRFVRPDTTILKISNGDTLTVKKRLNAGENKRMLRRGIVLTAEGGRRVDTIEAGTAKCLAFLLDWSLVGLDGKVVMIRDQSAEVVESALNAIDPDSYSEIIRAIEAHETAMDAERDAEKNSQDGRTTSPEISPSLVGVAGGTSGSAS